MTATISGLIWLAGGVLWYVIRAPFEFRNRKKNVVVNNRRDVREKLLLTSSLSGLGLVPMLYVATGWPRFADYPFQVWQGWLGVVVMLGALYMMRRSHKDLGRNWSDSLQVREAHTLVTAGVYRVVRHPMYSAFWLMAVAQLLLLPNWIAGPAGMIGFGILFFGRVAREEAMMLEAFGDEYRAYMARTARVLPGLY